MPNVMVPPEFADPCAVVLESRRVTPLAIRTDVERHLLETRFHIPVWTDFEIDRFEATA